MEKHKDTPFRTETSCKELNNIFTYRVLKCDIIKNLLCETIGFFGGIMKEQYPKGLCIFAKNEHFGANCL